MGAAVDVKGLCVVARGEGADDQTIVSDGSFHI